MNETIYIEHPWKIKDISTGFKYHLKSTTTLRIASIVARLTGITLMFTLILRYMLLDKFLELKDLFDIVMIIFCLFINKILIYIFSYSYKRKNYENKQMEWQISSEKIVCRMINLFETKMSWDLIQGVLDTPECFLMYPQEQMFFWLPKYAFKSEEDIAQFAFIAQDKVKNWQQIK